MVETRGAFDPIRDLLQGLKCTFATTTYGQCVRIVCGQLYEEEWERGNKSVKFIYGDVGISTNLSDWMLITKSGQPLVGSINTIGRQDVSSVIEHEILNVWFVNGIFTVEFANDLLLLCIPYGDNKEEDSLVTVLHKDNWNYSLLTNGEIKMEASRPRKG